MAERQEGLARPCRIDPRRVEAATTAGRLVVARQGGWGQVDGSSNSNEANGGVAGVAGAGIEGASAGGIPAVKRQQVV